MTNIKLLVFGNPKGERNVDLDICGEKVEQTQSIKILLGVNPDDDLNFRDHIRGMCKKVGGMIGILRKFKNLIPVIARLLAQVTAQLCHTLPIVT